MSFRPAPAFLLLSLLLPGCRRTTPAAGVHAVVLLTCDTLRADRLGLYGCERSTSPSLDDLARESLVFEAAWSTAPLTGPSLSALLTGRPPLELGLADNRDLLAGAATTLAERLSASGIRSAAIVSNWALRRRPELADAGVQQGFAHFDDRMRTPEASRPDLMERTARDTTDAALAWLAAHPRAERFFLWVHYQDPHGPYTPPPECLAPEEPSTEEPELPVGSDHRGRGELPVYQVVDAERRPAAYRARYEAEIRYFDRELGRLVEGLRENGLLERALLVFTADHGESLGEHGYFFSHGQHLHQELVRVPLFLRPPGGAEPSSRERAPASHLDLFPTILTAFGLDPGPTRGLDLLGPPLPTERVLPQYLRGTWSATGARHRLLVGRGEPRLFDLVADPGEQHDLAASEPELVRAMAEAHRSFLRRGGDFPPLSPAKPELDEAAERALDALGYGGDDHEH
jgi:arylsulfatase